MQVNLLLTFKIVSYFYNKETVIMKSWTTLNTWLEGGWCHIRDVVHDAITNNQFMTVLCQYTGCLKRHYALSYFSLFLFKTNRKSFLKIGTHKLECLRIFLIYILSSSDRKVPHWKTSTFDPPFSQHSNQRLAHQRAFRLLSRCIKLLLLVPWVHERNLVLWHTLYSFYSLAETESQENPGEREAHSTRTSVTDPLVGKIGVEKSSHSSGAVRRGAFWTRCQQSCNSKDIRMFPYKMPAVHQLENQDYH